MNAERRKQLLALLDRANSLVVRNWESVVLAAEVMEKAEKNYQEAIKTRDAIEQELRNG